MQSGRGWVVCGVAELGGRWLFVVGEVRAGALWAGERERGVVGGVEGLEVWEAVGEAHDQAAGGADDPAGDAEQDVPQRLGVPAERRVLVVGLAGGCRGRADVAYPGG